MQIVQIVLLKDFILLVVLMMMVDRKVKNDLYVFGTRRCGPHLHIYWLLVAFHQYTSGRLPLLHPPGLTTLLMKTLLWSVIVYLWPVILENMDSIEIESQGEGDHSDKVSIASLWSWEGSLHSPFMTPANGFSCYSLSSVTIGCMLGSLCGHRCESM